MSLATITHAYDRKAKSKDGGAKEQPVLKTAPTRSRDLDRKVRSSKNVAIQNLPAGWEYFLNPLEYE